MRYVVTSVPKAPESGPRARTHAALLQAAMELIRTGIMPSVAQVAARADVSRATAYRYFPSRSKLIAAVVDTSLGPVRTTASKHESARERVMELFDHTFPRFKEYETEMRAALQLALEHRALERAGMLDEEPYRRGHRVKILAQALLPFENQIPKPLIRRLHKALSTIYGYEAYVVLKDIWNASDREVESTVRWMATALIDATLAEAKGRGSDPTGLTPGKQRRSIKGSDPMGLTPARKTKGVGPRTGPDPE
ncbi:TetR/AcrR family transcriptional regulator [Alcaligenaceae bacterium]|nr:TetR/AcrR family transcriptional regulator [Alcaligenaceae bacterium]